MINQRRQGERRRNNNHNHKGDAKRFKPNRLYELVRNGSISYRKLKAISTRASTHPIETHLRNETGWTVLQYAIEAYRYCLPEPPSRTNFDAAPSNAMSVLTRTAKTPASTWKASSVMRLFRQFLDAISMIVDANPTSIYHDCAPLPQYPYFPPRTPLSLACHRGANVELALLYLERFHYLSSLDSSVENSCSTTTSYVGDLLKVLLRYNPSTVHVFEERRDGRPFSFRRGKRSLPFVTKSGERCDRPIHQLYQSYYELWKEEFYNPSDGIRYRDNEEDGGDDEEGDGRNDGGTLGDHEMTWVDAFPLLSLSSSTTETFLTLYLSSRCRLHHHIDAKHPSATVLCGEKDAAAAAADKANEEKGVRTFNLTELISNNYKRYNRYYDYYYYTSCGIMKKNGHRHRYHLRYRDIDSVKAAEQWDFILYIVRCNIKSNWVRMRCLLGGVSPRYSWAAKRRPVLRTSTMDDLTLSTAVATAAAAPSTCPTVTNSHVPLGSTPISAMIYSRLAQSFWHQIALLLSAAAAAANAHSTTTPSSSSVLSIHHGYFRHSPEDYNKGRPVPEQLHPLHVLAELLIAYGCDYDDVNETKVSAFAELPPVMNYLVVLFHMACLLYHDELSVRIAKTGGGMTPLFLLLRHSGSSSSLTILPPPPMASEIIRRRGGIEHCISQCVQWMVYLYPPCAAIPDRYTLRYPLHVAIEQTARWICLLDRLQLLGDLVDAAPHLLRQRDVDTKLYPFMLAAVRLPPEPAYSRGTSEYGDDGSAPSVEFSENQRKKGHIRKETRLDLNSLNVTYELLRILPDVLTGAGLF